MVVKISVIIPVLNERAFIRTAVLSAIDGQPEQIIVCDGGSVDGTLEIARDLPCEVITSPPGRGLQMALGAKHARGDLLVFLHADCSLSAACLTQLRERATAKSWGCFQHRIDAVERRFRWLEKGNHWRTKYRGLVYGDQALWVCKTAYESVGGFPEVPLMEDVRISEALKKIGRPIVLPGPVKISARHWKRRGVVRTTLRNQLLMGLYRCGCSPDRLVALYRK